MSNENPKDQKKLSSEDIAEAFEIANSSNNILSFNSTEKEESKMKENTALDTLNPKKEKYITTIVIETDKYPEELVDGYVAFFMNLSSNPNLINIEKGIKKV